MLEDWHRIGDKDFAGFGRREITAKRSDTGEIYSVVANDGEQDTVRVIYNGVEYLLDVQRKHISQGGIYRLSGGLNDRDHKFAIDKYAWVELLLAPSAVISYWGNAILLRQDFED